MARPMGTTTRATTVVPTMLVMEVAMMAVVMSVKEKRDRRSKNLTQMPRRRDTHYFPCQCASVVKTAKIFYFFSIEN
ncbi:MAG: hypothetical protein AAFZ01_13075 [Pseudomonadota bacterium]